MGASAVAVGVYALKHIVGPYAVMLYRRMYGYSDTVAKEEREKEKEEEQKTAHILASAIQSQVSPFSEAHSKTTRSQALHCPGLAYWGENL